MMLILMLDRDHPWFRIDLADYLFPHTDEEKMEYDETCIIDICHVSILGVPSMGCSDISRNSKCIATRLLSRSDPTCSQTRS